MLRVASNTLNQRRHQASHRMHVHLVWHDYTSSTHFIQDVTEIHSLGLLAVDGSLRPNLCGNLHFGHGHAKLRVPSVTTLPIFRVTRIPFRDQTREERIELLLQLAPVSSFSFLIFLQLPSASCSFIQRLQLPHALAELSVSFAPNANLAIREEIHQDQPA